ncbi:tyrosine-protein kinase Src64B-like isoform X1 [Ctenocephalides felis]|uniref:tyrosine-protein kinase Src64B-like isoform X1 n=1 Tax=Ctenocephalides felis TaxID=7515 RepID=UPI000E6E34F9|nr:tyrosine-protein kinase Src64B-like isoform X1 [Ctenocephalides felis]
MGNRCCKKSNERPSDRPLVIQGKKTDPSFGPSMGMMGNHMNGGMGHMGPGGDSRYTPDPYRGAVRGGQAGADIIRTRNTTAHQSSTRRRIVVGVYSYEAREQSDVSFRKGDRMEVLDDSESDWWRVLHLTTRQEGLIPWNFVAEERSVESEDWFFDHISRKEADKLLLSDENPRGTFLVRPSEHNPQGYSLSVKDWEEQRGYHVKHYKIKPLDNGGFYIATNQTFPSLPALVLAYTNADNAKEAAISIPQLVRACRKPRPRMFDLSNETSKGKNWEIPLEDIDIREKLASGNFGTVCLGLWKGKTEVAIKKLNKSDVKSINDFKQEAKIMKTVRHEHLLALLGICQTDDELYIITEYMKNGALLDYLHMKGKMLKKTDLYGFAEQIASGMVYLEEQKYIHRDLAARNVLVDEMFGAKICDFGLSRAIQDDIYESRSRVCAVKWTAPEALEFQKYTHKSDVWSYGIVLHEIFSLGKVPYPGMKSSEMIDNLRNGHRMAKPDLSSEETYELMLKCWAWDKDNRPEFKEIHEFMKKICDDGYMSSNMDVEENAPLLDKN